MVVAELFEILVGWVIHGRKLLENKVFMKSKVGVCESKFSELILKSPMTNTCLFVSCGRIVLECRKRPFRVPRNALFWIK